MSELDPSRLRRLGADEPLHDYLAEAWARREFAVVVPANDLRAQNMDTVLGQLWHFLNPAALVGVYWLVFGVLLSTDRGVPNFLGFLVVGVLLFQLTQRVAQDGAVAIPRNEGLIRSIQFPRALLPISSLVGQTIAFVPAIGVMLVTLLATGETPSARWLLFPLVLTAHALFNLGLAFLAAKLGAITPDLPQVLPHLFRLVFYLSGILFSVERVVDNDTLVDLCAANPIYAFVTAARWCLIGSTADAGVWISMLAWAVLAPVVGLLWFRVDEHRYGA